MNDGERRLWVLNDEELYRSWQRSRKGLYVYVRKYREAIDKYINRSIRGKQP